MEYFPRRDDFYGDAYVVPVLYEDPQGRSASDSEAIANAEHSYQVKFVGTEQKEDYAAINIRGKVMMQASKNAGSFLRARETQIKGMLRNLGKSLHISLYRSGSGSLSQIGAIDGSGTVLTLSNKSESHFFGKGQTLIANDTDDSAGMKAGGVKVEKRDGANGTITVDQDVSGLWAVGDYLFTQGDQQGKVVGLDGWLPQAVTSDSFFSVDRTLDSTRLGGHRVAASATISATLQELAVLIGEEGGEPDTIFMNPRDGLVLSAELGLEVERRAGGKAVTGFRGFCIDNFVTGPIDVVFDHACQQGRAYMLERDTWVLATMGAVPHIIRDDGSDSQRNSGADSIQIRARYFCELFCEAPGKNGVAVLPV